MSPRDEKVSLRRTPLRYLLLHPDKASVIGDAARQAARSVKPVLIEIDGKPIVVRRVGTDVSAEPEALSSDLN